MHFGSTRRRTLVIRPRRHRPSPASLDRIDLMQTFVRIVEAGSLSAAATLLGPRSRP